MTEAQDGLIILDEHVISKIHMIRGQKVMFDKDLAELYGVEPKRLREQVKRNNERFPANFFFQLSENELYALVSQFATPPKTSQFGGHLPYVFTEHGVLMLASILRSKTAMQASVRIIEIFVKMREILSTRADVLLKLEQLENKVTDHDEEIKTIFAYLKQLITPPEQMERRRIGFRRQEENE